MLINKFGGGIILDITYNCQHMVIIESRLTFVGFIIVLQFRTDNASPILYATEWWLSLHVGSDPVVTDDAEDRGRKC